MCDKKNSVLFTDTECFVLSPDFKLADESHVLLKVPRKNNMYSVDIKNVVPKKDLTCLTAKETTDESMLWHRRLGTTSNDFAGKGSSFDAGQSGMETRPSQDYILMPLWNDISLFDSSPKASDASTPKASSRKIIRINTRFNPTVRLSGDYFGANNDMRSLDGVEFDIRNLSTTYHVPTTLNTRINKDHYLDNVIGDMQSGMDVESAFLYGRIKEEVYVCQPPGFEDPDYPDKVYKVEKALYGLRQAPRAWFETLAKYLLDNGFRRGKIDQTLFIKRQKEDILLVQYEDVKPASTPMDKEKALLKDSDGDDVDVHLYRSMIRSLMYLTSSRPDIMFASIISKPLSVIYILSIVLVTLSLSHNRPKPSTLIELYSSHLSLMENLELCDKYKMVAFLKKPQGSEDFHQIVDFLKAIHIRTLDNGEIELNATVDGQVKTITEASVRRHLKLADADGISTLPTTEIFEQLALIG
nr:putative ribonuclease H-like domain-containing protein [Tanacetum cinerariifolium]